MQHTIESGAIVAANVEYEVAIAGDYFPADFVPCRRRCDSGEATCAFLAASVLGIEIEES